MTFVPMTAPAVLTASIWQKFNTILALAVIITYFVTYLNNLDFAGEKWWCPTLDGPTHFPMHQWLPFLSKPQAQFAINISLVILWWVQHMLMAKSFFKNYCYETLGYQYAAFERSNFTFASTVAIGLVMIFWQKSSGPDYNLLEELPKTAGVLVYVGLGLIGMAVALLMITLWAMLDNDIFGFQFIRQLRWDGFEFPFSESLKHLSRFDVMMRHPIYTCQLLFFSGALLTCPWNFARIAQIGSMTLFTLIGTLTEEWDCKQFKYYNEWLASIPNRWIPDISRLSMSEADLNKLRKHVGQKVG